MLKTVKNKTNVEKLICMVADNQKFAKPNDKLTALIEKSSDYISEELSEEELEFVMAAKMPEVPKYKQIKK